MIHSHDSQRQHRNDLSSATVHGFASFKERETILYDASANLPARDH
jgi:hypothetical protein